MCENQNLLYIVPPIYIYICIHARARVYDLLSIPSIKDAVSHYLGKANVTNYFMLCNFRTLY